MFDRIDRTVFEQELTALRREFHRFPETAWTEFRTTARIIEELETLGLTVQYGPAIHVRDKMVGVPSDEELERHMKRATADGARADLVEAMRGGYTGCITVIEGALPGPTIGIRVDIDSLDQVEADDPAHTPAAEGFASVYKGRMHSCGHDAHAAIGVGTARLLCAYRDQLHGKVILAFQPGEESLRGAVSMTAAGHFSQCDYFFSAHVGLGDTEVGTVAASAHGFLASTKMDVTFLGKAAHSGASPEEGKNALAAASTAVLNLLAIPRHHAGASRVNVGVLHAGTARNIIPDTAEMMVETRGATSEINDYMEASARRVIRAAAEMYGCSHEIKVAGSANTIFCDPPLVARTAEILAQVEGVDEVRLDFAVSGCEDVITMMRDVQAHGGQATELVLGMPLKAPHHNSFFDVDERVLGVGARCFAQLALRIGEDAQK